MKRSEKFFVLPFNIAYETSFCLYIIIIIIYLSSIFMRIYLKIKN